MRRTDKTGHRPAGHDLGSRDRLLCLLPGAMAAAIRAGAGAGEPGGDGGGQPAPRLEGGGEAGRGRLDHAGAALAVLAVVVLLLLWVRFPMDGDAVGGRCRGAGPAVRPGAHWLGEGRTVLARPARQRNVLDSALQYFLALSPRISVRNPGFRGGGGETFPLQSDSCQIKIPPEADPHATRTTTHPGAEGISSPDRASFGVGTRTDCAFPASGDPGGRAETGRFPEASRALSSLGQQPPGLVPKDVSEAVLAVCQGHDADVGGRRAHGGVLLGLVGQLVCLWRLHHQGYPAALQPPVHDFRLYPQNPRATWFCEAPASRRLTCDGKH